MSVKYDLVMREETYHNEHWCIEILEGELEGFVYQYDTVKFHEDEEGAGFLDFNILTVENPNEYDLTSESTTSILGDVLCEIVEENLRESVENGNGNINTEAPAE